MGGYSDGRIVNTARCGFILNTTKKPLGLDWCPGMSFENLKYAKSRVDDSKVSDEKETGMW